MISSTVLFKRILVPTDFSETARETYAVATRLAHGADAQIHLVHEAPSFPLQVAEADARRHLEELDVVLAREASSEHFEGRKIATHLLRPGRLDDFEIEQGIDLIVCSTHGRSGVAREILGSFSERLLRSANAPLLLHREGSRSHAPREVLVPFDFSEKSRLVLPIVHELAERHGTHFTFLLVHEIAPKNSPFYDALHGLTGESLARARKRFETFRNEELSGVVSTLETAEGVPHFEIVERLRSGKFDLVLLGTYGIPGRVAQNVSRFAPCTVLAVRGEGAHRREPPRPEHRHLGRAQVVRPPPVFTTRTG